MSEKWDFYWSNVEDKIASIYLDLGAINETPPPDKTCLLCIWVYFLDPTEDGLSRSTESSVLFDIEDSLVETVGVGLEAQYVGRMTTDGYRLFYFYGASSDRFDEAVSRGMIPFSSYKWDTHHETDADWSQYRTFLFPSTIDRQKIMNRHVIHELEKAGDQLTLERPVSHWVYFSDVRNRMRFAKRARGLGFKVISEFEAEAKDDRPQRPFGVTIERTDCVELNAINQVTAELLELAESTSGNYDGWETEVDSTKANKPTIT